MTDGVLHEAYGRFHGKGPEWGEDRLTNHGPMAVEALVRHGYGERVHRWVDAYIRRLDDLPVASDRITEANWRAALGDGRRVGDWTAYFSARLAERPWREVVVTWWPRLLPGILGGATHGVIRVSHAVRALLREGDTAESSAELAHGLAFWAARVQYVPGATEPTGDRGVAQALDALPRVANQTGNVAYRLGQLADDPRWPGALAALRAPSDAADAARLLTALVDDTTPRYLYSGHASPVLLVHTATAPNAVLRMLPVLPERLWAPSLGAVWAATAAIVSAYAPADRAPAEPTVPDGPDAAATVFDRAVEHGDEHAIKLADTAVDVYCRTGDRDALGAAVRATTLIGAA